MNCSMPGLPVHHQLLESTQTMSILSLTPSNHLILCRPFPFLPSIFPSIRVFSNESALCIRWPKYWNFSFNISPSNEHTCIRNKLSCITFSIINMANTFVIMLYLIVHHHCMKRNQQGSSLWSQRKGLLLLMILTEVNALLCLEVFF